MNCDVTGLLVVTFEQLAAQTKYSFDHVFPPETHIFMYLFMSDDKTNSHD